VHLKDASLRPQRTGQLRVRCHAELPKAGATAACRGRFLT
jgi:hypothetical protein